VILVLGQFRHAKSALPAKIGQAHSGSITQFCGQNVGKEVAVSSSPPELASFRLASSIPSKARKNHAPAGT
jgi:hypothetical protein